MDLIKRLLEKMHISSGHEQILINQLLEYDIHDQPDLIPQVIDLIMELIFKYTDSCQAYARFCKLQVEVEHEISLSAGQERVFRKTLIKKVQTKFEGLYIHVIKRPMKFEKRGIELKHKEKKTMIGVLRFLIELYRNYLITDSILAWCFTRILKLYEITNDETFIDYAILFAQNAGPIIFCAERQHKFSSKLDAIWLPLFHHFFELKNQVSDEHCQTIFELELLHENNWTRREVEPSEEEDGPITDVEAETDDQDTLEASQLDPSQCRVCFTVEGNYEFGDCSHKLCEGCFEKRNPNSTLICPCREVN